jgi:hypothetical protein
MNGAMHPTAFDWDPLDDWRLCEGLSLHEAPHPLRHPGDDGGCAIPDNEPP